MPEPSAPLEGMTPTGLQSALHLTLRRAFVTVLNVATWIFINALAWSVLSHDGWTVVDILIALCFAIGTPWSVLGFWNALIGLYLLHIAKDPIADVAPYAAAGQDKTPLFIRTAIFMTLRNEDPARAINRLKIVKASVDATGEGAKFDYFILSDTDRPEVALQEERLAASWAALDGADRIIYRRRTDNTGYKAGNVRDFCSRWGAHYELMLPLDADSIMAGETIVQMTRMMQAHPKLGILQSLVVGMPTQSPFARIFQFGMRHGMRSYTMGQAWWVGDCGPFWGHNALVRIRPFTEQCELPVLPGGPPLGGHILSHDQVEATFMRRAGYDVRVMPLEGGSWEENPPTILEFMRRDTRWCQGNMQYLKLLDTPGLKPMSRFQLLWAILMFVGVPAWTLLIILAALKPFDGESGAGFPTGLAILTYLTYLVMYLMPKIAGFIDILIAKGQAERYGGSKTFLWSALIELGFSFLMGAVVTLRTGIFMVGLAFGKSVTWGGQQRDARALGWDEATQNLWPQTLLGVLLFWLMAKGSMALLLWSLPLTAGYLLAIPFSVLSTSPALGEWLKARNLCAIPEEFDPPAEITKALS